MKYLYTLLADDQVWSSAISVCDRQSVTYKSLGRNRFINCSWIWKPICNTTCPRPFVPSLGKVQLKAAGGVRTLDAVLACRAVGCTRVGATVTVVIMEEAIRREAEGRLVEVAFQILSLKAVLPSQTNAF